MKAWREDWPRAWRKQSSTAPTWTPAAKRMRDAGDSIAIRPVGVLAQTFDHRAVDGAYSAAFLREVKTILQTRDWMQALNA